MAQYCMADTMHINVKAFIFQLLVMFCAFSGLKLLLACKITAVAILKPSHIQSVLSAVFMVIPV